MTGAARLVALAARRIGAGLVSIAAPENAAAVYQAAEPGNLIQAITGSEDFRTLLDDRRKNAVLVGPGAGQGEKTRNLVLAALSAGKGAVIDADGLTSFSENPSALFDCVNGPCVFTPHDGEFAQLFDTTGSKLERARRAAAQSGAVIVLKGADTVIAAPGGRAIVNTSGTPYLATAGSGDVLAGLIIGLMTQEMAAFDAAACAAWIHGRAAEWFGPGLIAEDLVGQIPDVLEELQVYEN
jgi:ADP-dependent NAD(P)H-hydrate dehydratase / NAD(P)H-hydrate epimerase